ncbi:MAG: ribosome silencing factor [Treponema sp.]|jgi:ribosome-associated protein|nr:ribosome silencing factor [Treponema sp.]
MDDTLQADKVAQELGELLRDHNGKDVVVLDLRELNIWTDFFIIATVTSYIHVQGLLRHIKEFAREKDLEIFHRRRKPDPDNEWNLVDMGNIVVHLMSERARSFYELERLWT